MSKPDYKSGSFKALPFGRKKFYFSVPFPWNTEPVQKSEISEKRVCCELQPAQLVVIMPWKEDKWTVMHGIIAKSPFT